MKSATIRIRLFDLSAVLALCLLWAVVLNAQESRGRVQGVVTDTTDAAVSGASVRLQSVDTGVSTVRQTDNYGHYLFDLVSPGAYKLFAETPGFSRFEQDNLQVPESRRHHNKHEVAAGRRRRDDKVSDAPPAVQFNTSGMDLTIDNGLVSNLPVVAVIRSPSRCSIRP